MVGISILPVTGDGEFELGGDLWGLVKYCEFGLLVKLNERYYLKLVRQ